MLDGRQRILHHKFNIDIDVDLLQNQPHGGRLGVCKHDKLGVGWGLIVMQFVLRSTVREEAAPAQSLQKTKVKRKYLSSSPPSLRTIFLREKTVPNTSLASSSALSGTRAGPMPLGMVDWEEGREPFAPSGGGNCQFFLYMQSAGVQS